MNTPHSDRPPARPAETWLNHACPLQDQPTTLTAAIDAVAAAAGIDFRAARHAVMAALDSGAARLTSDLFFVMAEPPAAAARPDPAAAPDGPHGRSRER